ncbi:hypothetical protein [Allosphingosinicella vermicomposti]|uniref:hypothetical protein n=1 Tax=Allosphingosinicella vermicomposti TaxID=614671 RepID=UPI00131A551B|nr:hypothetical protein [Allosphingosinicella vermicomposti]
MKESDESSAPFQPKIPAFAGMTGVRIATAAIIGLLAASPATTRGGDSLAALSSLEAGRWQLRDLNSGRASSLCLGNRRALMQVRHSGQCAWTVIRNEAKDATIAYTCGDGSGRTALRVETPRLAQIDTQGVLGGIPYAMRAEARHVGSC